MADRPDYFPFVTTALSKMLWSAAGVALASLAGIWVGSSTGSVVSPFWPASGVAVGAVLWWGRSALPGVFAGVLVFNLYLGLPGTFVGLGALALTLEAWLAAIITRAIVGKRARPDTLRGLLAVVLGGAWLPPILNAMICARFMPLADGTPFLTGWNDGTRFVLANGFGIALITPVMLAWWRMPARGWWKRFALTSGAAVAGIWLVFEAELPTVLLLVPAIAAALGTGLRGASVICSATATVVVVFTGLGFGPLSNLGGDDYLRIYSLFAVLAFGVLPVGAAGGEYRRILRQRHAAEKAAGLRFWEWNDTDGLSFEGGEPPLQLFHAEPERGSLETKFGGRDALSFWQVVEKRPDGSPREVAGMLIDASERMQMEKTRRQTWESEVELRNLRASLTPHLLFNCLAAVRGIVRTDPEKARTFIDALSRFLRESTDAQSRETVPLHDEWQLCEDFLGLQALRYERELPRLAAIDGPAHHAQLPPMMLLNLVENAVKHGEITQKHPLVVRAVLRGEKLVVEVRNRGTLGPPPQGRAGGVGTANARLHATYGQDASLAIRQEGENVVATIELPAGPPRRGVATP
jgi:integral membrane sensor domain MASE1